MHIELAGLLNFIVILSGAIDTEAREAYWSDFATENLSTGLGIDIYVLISCSLDIVISIIELYSLTLRLIPFNLIQDHRLHESQNVCYVSFTKLLMDTLLKHLSSLNSAV